jgi:hypothetical protein
MANETIGLKQYHLYGVLNGIERDWGDDWSTRNAALKAVESLLDDNFLTVEEEYFRDDPHKHLQVLVCSNHRDRFFIDRVIR